MIASPQQLQQRKDFVHLITQYGVQCMSNAPGGDAPELQMLHHLINLNCKEPDHSAYVFVEHGPGADIVQNYLQDRGFTCKQVRDRMSPAERQTIVQEFNDGTFKILISSEKSYKTLYVSDDPRAMMVVNFDIPRENCMTPDYSRYKRNVQRCRFEGVAYTLVGGEEDQALWRDMANFFSVQTMPISPEAGIHDAA